MSSIVLTGLAASDPVPGQYLQIDFAQGQASLGSATYGALIIATKSSAGSATAGTVIYSQTSNPPLATESDAIALFGAGSPAHRMWRRFVAVNKTTPVSVICAAESAGAAATGTITYATNASAAGVTRVYVGEEFVERSVSSGDTPTVTAAAVVALINAQTHWPVTASNLSGVITITWKVAGPQGNWGRYSATITGGIGTTVTPAAQTFMTGGTTLQSYTTVLSTILPYRYYYIIAEESAVAGSSANFTALSTQVNSQALPITGIRQRCFTGTVDTLANAITSATGLNSARAEVIWSQNNDRTPEGLAATVAGIYALEEQGLNFRCNFSGYGNDATTSVIWNVKAPLSGTAPTRADFVSALNNGVTPIGVNASGTTYLVKRVTSRSLNGAVSDYRIRDAHKVTVLDKFGDDAQAKATLQFSGKKIGNDVAQGQRTPGPDVVTPAVYKASLIKLLRDYEELDLLENVDATIAAMVVQRETSPTTRLSARVPADVIDIFDQSANLISQVG